MNSKIVCREANTGVVLFYCPGCKGAHGVDTVTPNPLTGAKWLWNGSVSEPTFSPSIHVLNPCCHSFVKNGRIQYLEDSYHELSGKTVDLPDFDSVFG